MEEAGINRHIVLLIGMMRQEATICGCRLMKKRHLKEQKDAEMLSWQTRKKPETASTVPCGEYISYKNASLSKSLAQKEYLQKLLLKVQQ